MEAQETNVDLSDFKIPKVYINGMWKEFPDYRINRDGTKVYNIKKRRYISITLSRASKQVHLVDVYGNGYRCAINRILWFTFEYDNLDLSGCKPVYYNYKYYPRYLINSNGTIVFDTKYKIILNQLIKPRKSKSVDSRATYYLRLNLNLDSKFVIVYVHQLVKWTYKGGPETELKSPIIDPTVDHKDGNGLNNDITNLQWLSRSFNASKGVSGDKHGGKVINTSIAEKICVELCYTELSIRDIAEKFGISSSVVRHIYRGKTWRGISQKYMPFPERAKTVKKKESI